MAKVQKKNELTKVNDIKMNKISIFFKRPVLKSTLKILTMEHGGFRTFKAVKNINKLFANIDLNKYTKHPDLVSYIWCICYFSKQWLAGIVSPGLIAEMAKTNEEYDNIKGEIISKSIADNNIITAPEAKATLDLISAALQGGYIVSIKDEYMDLLDDITIEDPSSIFKIIERLFKISKSLLDIQHSTNMITNKVEFNTTDPSSMKEAICTTLESLSNSSSIFRTGIKRLNTLLSPGYMNGRLYVYLGLPGAGKSIMLLKSALDARKFNPNFKPKTPGMKPAVLYITMENTFTETIERIWNMITDEPMINYSQDEVYDIMCEQLGITKILKDDVTAYTKNEDGTVEKHTAQVIEPPKSELNALLNNEKKDEKNIEIIIQYYPYKSITTDDLYTIINDLREENVEVDMLVFDYIKRIDPANPVKDNLRMELDHIVNELKALAVVEDIPVVTAHQMNRAAASIVDQAIRQGKSDVNKLVGRENVGDSWSVIETADFAATLGAEYKKGTDDKYMTINIVKRRRIDMSESEFAKFTFLAHPFAKNNGLRLIDDMNLDKVLSLQSLNSDIDIEMIGKEKVNAVSRLKTLPMSEFEEF